MRLPAEEPLRELRRENLERTSDWRLTIYERGKLRPPRKSVVAAGAVRGLQPILILGVMVMDLD